MTIKFTLQDPAVTKALRKDFEHRDLNHKFVKWLYRKGYLNDYKHKINFTCNSLNYFNWSIQCKF